MAKIYLGNLPPGIPEREVEDEQQRLQLSTPSSASSRYCVAKLYPTTVLPHHVHPPPTRHLSAGSTTPRTPHFSRQFSRLTQLAVLSMVLPDGNHGFIEFEDQRDAEDAVRKLDGYRGWRVEFSRTVNRGPSGRFGRSPPRGRGRSPSPIRRRRSPSYERRNRRSPSYDRHRRSRSRSRSRAQRDRSRDRRRSPSASPARRRSISPPPRRRSESPVRRERDVSRERSPSPVDD